MCALLAASVLQAPSVGRICLVSPCQCPEVKRRHEERQQACVLLVPGGDQTKGNPLQVVRDLAGSKLTSVSGQGCEARK